MQREAVRPDGVRRVLQCVARSIEGHAALVDEAGRRLRASPELPPDFVGVVTAEVDRIRTGQAHSVAAELDTQVVVALSISHPEPGPVLVAAGEKETVARLRELLADAARLLWLCWQAEEARLDRERFDLADSQAREAVLHLLMVGDRGGAGRVAATLGPKLGDPIRVYVVDCGLSGEVRARLVAQCTDICDDQAWVVRCPVYARHVIVIAPVPATLEAGRSAGGAIDPVEERFRSLSRHMRGVHVGASEVVSLRETAGGYEQAFHALAAAKCGAEPYARFNPRSELPALLGEAGRGWARRTLAPLLDYVPARAHDPGAQELRTTLESWLSFYNGAARQLKIHRNTVSARLKLVERLLDCDVRQVRTQATLQLAMRIIAYPRLPSVNEDSVDVLLHSAAVRLWAQRQLEPLLTDDTQASLATLRTWLANDARLDTTAAALGISVPGARKRLLRLEGTLERSVLNGPSARYDLWLALRILDGQGL
jgi:sugar diacid utilization regulator